MTTNIMNINTKSDNFFIAFWNGDVSLAASFWGVYFLLSTVLTGVAGYLTQFLPSSLCFGLLTIFLIYSMVGLYRSVIKNPSHPFINFLVYLCLLGRVIKIILLFAATIGVMN